MPTMPRSETQQIELTMQLIIKETTQGGEGRGGGMLSYMTCIQGCATGQGMVFSPLS